MRENTGRVLKDQVAIITGGSGAIAEGCAQCLMRDGATVVLIARQPEPLAETRERLLRACPEGEVLTITGDCLDVVTVRSALAQAHALHDRLDIIIPTVGQGQVRPLMLHDVDTFRQDWELNVISAFIAIRYGAPLLRPGGAITCISSIVATRPPPWMSAYSTAKGGLEAFVRAAAEELSAAQIRVNAVRPGFTRSRLRGAMFEDAELMQIMLREIPLGRAGEPLDIGAAVRFLSGPEASWVTGQTFAVDGGNELRKNPNLEGFARAKYGDAIMDDLQRGAFGRIEQEP